MKIALLIFSVSALVGAVSWYLTGEEIPALVNNKSYLLISSRGRFIRGERDSRFYFLENYIASNALSGVSIQTDIEPSKQAECAVLLSSCMDMKEEADHMALEMFDYLMELQEIALQVEFMKSFSITLLQEDDDSGEQEIDEPARKAIIELSRYNNRYQMLSSEQSSVFFKKGFSALDDTWKYSLKSIIESMQMCSLVDLCAENYNIIIKKINEGRERVKLLDSSLTLMATSKHQGEDSMVKLIVNMWGDFRSRKSRFEGQEDFMSIDMSTLDITEILNSKNSAVKSSIPSLIAYKLPPRVQTWEDKLDKIVFWYVDNVMSRFIDTVEPRRKEGVQYKTVEEEMERIVSTSAFIPDSLVGLEVYSDSQFSKVINGLRLNVHFFKNAEVSIPDTGEVLFAGGTLRWDYDPMGGEAGWEWEKSRSFRFVDFDPSKGEDRIEPSMVFNVVCADTEGVFDLKPIDGEEGSFSATFKTWAACNHLDFNNNFI